MLLVRDRNRLYGLTQVRKVMMSLCLITSQWLSAVNMSKAKFWFIICLS